MQAMTSGAGHAELHATQFDGLGVTCEGVLSRLVGLGETAACQREQCQEF
jgi:hypothetical protein